MANSAHTANDPVARLTDEALAYHEAGHAVMHLHGARSHPAWSASDRAAAAALARDVTGGDDLEAAVIVEEAWTAAGERLAEGRTWTLVQRVAGALVERERLDGDEFDALMTR